MKSFIVNSTKQDKYILSTITIEKIDNYVYILIDPRDLEIFYVGKGKGNRINEHIRGVFKENKKESEKNKRIDEIIKAWNEVKQVIVRHWLSSENEAFQIECSIIDIFLLQWHKLTNIVKWHWSKETGIMDLEDIKIKYEAEDAIFDNDEMILININSLYKKNMSYNEIYEATKKSWRVDPKRANKTRIVCCVYKWIIREVFEITEPRNIDKERCENHPWKTNRYYFTWKLAGDIIRNKYLHKSVKNYWKKWAQQPIKYINI
jgi:uncharacterized protein